MQRFLRELKYQCLLEVLAMRKNRQELGNLNPASLFDALGRVVKCVIIKGKVLETAEYTQRGNRWLNSHVQNRLSPMQSLKVPQHAVPAQWTSAALPRAAMAT